MANIKMNKQERALRRSLIAAKLQTANGIDAVVRLLEATLANDDVNNDEAADAERARLTELVVVLGYGDDGDDGDDGRMNIVWIVEWQEDGVQRQEFIDAGDAERHLHALGRGASMRSEWREPPTTTSTARGKIVVASNFNDETLSDALVCENVDPFYAPKIVAALNAIGGVASTYHFKHVPHDYVLYVYDPR